MSIDTKDKNMANAIRFLAADAVQKANSGHPGMPMGMAEAATVLFSRHMKFDAKNPKWPDRDRFVLSAGHGSMLMYSLLYLTGNEEMTMDEIKNFRQLGSKTAGHPEYGHTSGVEATGGPLGQGITMAVGMALSERMMNARFGDDLVDHHTYVIVGDGCLMEGISQEAISMAGHLKLGKMVVLWDDNSICIDGATDKTTSDDQLKRFEASGWHAQTCDGHNPDAVSKAIEAAKMVIDRPSVISCVTNIGHGSPNKAGSAATHGAPLGDDEIALAREEMGWTHAAFEIPAGVLADWRAAGSKGGADRDAWEGRLAGSGHKGEFSRLIAGDLPSGWMDGVNAHKKKISEEAPKWATRKASQEALNLLTAAIPEMIGGSADLTGSNLTKTASTETVDVGDYSGRYIHYGVREHGMAAVMNGMALHGEFIPYGGTFLVFADYLRGALRLSALMGLRLIHVLTHDSIGVGEDGPTHQPVETLATLRALPNTNVFRPCDGVETAECWALAVADTDTPSCLALSRQGVPTLRTEHTDENLSAHGAYVLRDAEGGERKVTLIATGTEVSIAVEAREKLQAEGIPTAVVSMPSWELFEARDEAYRKEVLGPGSVRVACEAAIQMGWERYTGKNGGFVGMTGFGASAPGGALYEHFGITADAMVAEAKARL